VSGRWVRGRLDGRLEARNDFWGRMWPQRDGLFTIERLEGVLHEAELLDDMPPLDDDTLEVPVRVLPRIEVASLAGGGDPRTGTFYMTDARLSRLRCHDMRVEANGHGRAGRVEAVLVARLVTRPAPADVPRERAATVEREATRPPARPVTDAPVARAAAKPAAARPDDVEAAAPPNPRPDAPLARRAVPEVPASTRARRDFRIPRRPDGGGILPLLGSALGFLLQLLLFLLALPVLAMAFNWLLHVWNELWLWLPLPAIDTTLLPDGVRGAVEWARLNSGSMAVVTLAVVVLGTLLLRVGRARA
jgi:hypothetical protein